MISEKLWGHRVAVGMITLVFGTKEMTVLWRRGAMLVGGVRGHCDEKREGCGSWLCLGIWMCY
jgi:hypothetical protein